MSGRILQHFVTNMMHSTGLMFKGLQDKYNVDAYLSDSHLFFQQWHLLPLHLLFL